MENKSKSDGQFILNSKNPRLVSAPRLHCSFSRRKKRKERKGGGLPFLLVLEDEQSRKRVVLQRYPECKKIVASTSRERRKRKKKTKRREKAVPPADGGPREPTRGNASEREKERENLMSTASRMHRSVFGTRKVGAVVAGARANASRRAPNHNQALPRNNTLNTERRGHKHLLVITAAASEAAEAAEVESRSTLRIKLKCYSAEPLQVRLLFLLRKKKKESFFF